MMPDERSASKKVKVTCNFLISLKKKMKIHFELLLIPEVSGFSRKLLRYEPFHGVVLEGLELN